MHLDTVIFDMDGLLIDSEPLWNESALEVLGQLGITLNKTQFSLTTGLRTKEFLLWWFNYFKIDHDLLANAEKLIIEKVTEKVLRSGQAKPGVNKILDFFIQKKFKIGLASSSPLDLVNTVVKLLGIDDQFHAITSAAELEYGKPHPKVYLDCATLLKSPPIKCLAFEDSFNGMISAKAARMICIVVPDSTQYNFKYWNAANLKIHSLNDFDDTLLERLSP